MPTCLGKSCRAVHSVGYVNYVFMLVISLLVLRAGYEI